MGLQTLEDIAGNRGVVIVNDTDEYTPATGIDSIMVLEDTVFATLKIDGADVLSTYVTTPATAVRAGALIVPVAPAKFSAVDLTSGSVAVILG